MGGLAAAPEWEAGLAVPHDRIEVTDVMRYVPLVGTRSVSLLESVLLFVTRSRQSYVT
jgi:hypothetical protein